MVETAHLQTVVYWTVIYGWQLKKWSQQELQMLLGWKSWQTDLRYLGPITERHRYHITILGLYMEFIKG